MRKVKICGITNLKDAKCAIKSGADALGFVFYDKSARYITPQKALEIVEQIPPFIERVGLFVNATESEINSICKEAKMSLAQVHFEVKDEFYKSLHVKYLKVVRATCKEDILKNVNEFRIVDAFVKNYGGEGRRVELSWFENVDCSKIILAGGLEIDNLEEVKSLNFYGFDVSSGVEKQKGKKDHDKMSKFISKAKN
jgi:phosphoribosylanthranilate isomerase